MRTHANDRLEQIRSVLVANIELPLTAVLLFAQLGNQRIHQRVTVCSSERRLRSELADTPASLSSAGSDAHTTNHFRGVIFRDQFF